MRDVLKDWLHPLTQTDEDWIAHSLGRAPTGVLGVATRDQAGRPQVIVNHPLDGRGNPFPTLFWLVDAALSVRLADLERTGGVKALEDWLAQDAARLGAWHDEQARCAAWRWSLVDADVRGSLDAGRTAVLRDSGIGGMRQLDGVKCLHLTAAWMLACARTDTPSVTATWFSEVGALAQNH